MGQQHIGTVCGPRFPTAQTAPQRGCLAVLSRGPRGAPSKAGPDCRRVTQFLSSSAPQWSRRVAHTRVHAHGHTRTHTVTHTSFSASCTCTYMLMHTHVHTWTHAHIHTCTLAHTPCVHGHTLAHMHTHVHTDRHSRTHTPHTGQQTGEPQAKGSPRPPMGHTLLSPLSRQGGVAGPVHLGVTQTPHESSQHGVRGGIRRPAAGARGLRFYSASCPQVHTPSKPFSQDVSIKTVLWASRDYTPCFFWF